MKTDLEFWETYDKMTVGTKLKIIIQGQIILVYSKRYFILELLFNPKDSVTFLHKVQKSVSRINLLDSLEIVMKPHHDRMRSQ